MRGSIKTRRLPPAAFIFSLLVFFSVFALGARGCYVPPGLPRHLGIGLMSQPHQLSWMTSSGVPWDYRYQYLTGGVNTGGGWATWNYPYGSFADNYMRDSAAAGYIPVFTYYQIVPSAPDPWSENVAAKLQNPSTMNAYYSEWKMLMQKAGAFGRPVIVHVEPDLWGYMQMRSGTNAAAIPVSVRSSGFGEAAAFPDSAAGFAQALVRLRDAYAPNAVLGFHASHWATGRDLVINDTDPHYTADQIHAFYQSLGVHFDVIFFDPSDRDAAFYQYQTGDGGAHWWDNGDFDRYREFMGRLVDRTGRKAILWQVPVGNTAYRSLNNAWGHFQDNRVQYWLGDRRHLQEYVDAGLMAILFGGGAPGCTSYTDEMGDGVTNPAPIDGNVASAVYPDDDGGYLRLRAGEYCAAGKITF